MNTTCTPHKPVRFTGQATPEQQAIAISLDALRKIALDHPCDLHDRIAAHAVEKIKGLGFL